MRSERLATALVGVAPGACTFGSRRRRRRGQGGHFTIHRVLCMAMSSATCPAIEALDLGSNVAGKLPKVALVVCMHKRLTLLDAIVRTDAPWDGSLRHAGIRRRLPHCDRLTPNRVKVLPGA